MIAFDLPLRARQHFRDVPLPDDAPWAQYVKDHTRIEEIYQGKMWKVGGIAFGVQAARNMTIYRLKKTNGLLVHSPIALNENEMEIMQQIGEPEVGLSRCPLVVSLRLISLR